MAFDTPTGGVEAMVLSTSLDSGALARLAEPFLDAPPPFPPQALERWRANGLRVVGVPIGSLESVLNTLAPRGGTAQREWLGQPTSWSELARSPVQPSFLLALDGERLSLPAGSLRMLVRAWTRPVSDSTTGSARNQAQPGGVAGGAMGLSGRTGSTRPRACLRLELLPQHADERGPRRTEVVRRDETGEVIVTTPTRSALDEGVVFSSLGLEGELDGSQALLVVFEQPDVDWRRLAEQTRAEIIASSTDTDEPSGPPSTESDSVADSDAGLQPGQVARGTVAGRRTGGSNPSTSASSGAKRTTRPAKAPVRQEVLPAGPSGPVLPSLGQAMLTNLTPSAPPAPRVSTGDREGVAGERGQDGRTTTENSARKPVRRAVIVLVPKVPEHFSILPE